MWWNVGVHDGGPHVGAHAGGHMYSSHSSSGVSETRQPDGADLFSGKNLDLLLTLSVHTI